MALSSDRMLAPWNHLAQENVVVGFVDTLLRGCGQVMFQNNPVTGLLFLIGIFINSPLLGLAGLIGLIVSTVTAMLLRVERTLVRTYAGCDRGNSRRGNVLPLRLTER